jgi:pimeloyl-ACP methyl ester carboxylesterase
VPLYRAMRNATGWSWRSNRPQIAVRAAIYLPLTLDNFLNLALRQRMPVGNDDAKPLCRTTAGTAIDVGGFRLHLHCIGEGRPAVVLEAAMWDAGLTWSLVQPAVSEFARVCAYDRAGLGWSDSSPGPRTAGVMVEELRAVLTGGRVPTPFVLVAHSSSGILVRLFAHRYPEDVAGMVLVDSAHEEQFLRFPESIRNAQGPIWEQQRAMVKGLRRMMEDGSVDPVMIPVPPQFPPLEADRLRALIGTTKAADTMLAELHTMEAIHAEGREAGITTLGDIPLVVVTHGLPPPPFPPELGITVEDMRRYEETWRKLQEELAALSPRGRVVVADGAGHMIHHERPNVVVDAIRDVVAAAGS